MDHPPRETAGFETYHRRRGALFAAVLVVGLAIVRLRPFRVEIRGQSMQPTLASGDWCVAVRTGRVRAGQVVVLERPDRPGLEVVKRVARADDGGGWFVLGDNPAASTDSRQFGPVPESALVGRVRFVYWPPRRFRFI
jgi:nickel-type superoxide dismutase maturation protease